MYGVIYLVGFFADQMRMFVWSKTTACLDQKQCEMNSHQDHNQSYAIEKRRGSNVGKPCIFFVMVGTK